MTTGVGDYISVMSDGWYKVTSAATAPATPTITVANDGTGTSATVTVDGDAGVTNRLYYRKSTDSAWTTGGTRYGDGTIAATGLTTATYYFVVVSDSSGTYSLPSNMASVAVTGTVTGSESDLSAYIDDGSTPTALTTSGIDVTAETQTFRVNRRGRRIRVRLTEYDNNALEVVGITVHADVLDHE